MMASTQSSLAVPTNTSTSASAAPTSVGTNLGFIISLCMVEQCLRYADENIKSVYIYENYNITKIPANAFLGATYLEVSKPCTKISYMYICMEPWWRLPRYCPFVRGIFRSSVNSPHKGQCHGALISSLVCAFTSGWVNNRDAGDLRRHRAQYDTTVLGPCCRAPHIAATFLGAHFTNKY